MSHTVTVKTEIKDMPVLEACLNRIEGAKLVDGLKVKKHKIYSGTFEGVGVQLKDWRYPVIINPTTGEINYDNFNGSWGKQIGLDELVQGYTAQKLEYEASIRGLSMTEEKLADGSIKLTVNDYMG